MLYCYRFFIFGWVLSVGSEGFFWLFKLLVEEIFDVFFFIKGVLFWMDLIEVVVKYVWMFFDNISLLNVEKYVRNGCKKDGILWRVI